MEEQKNISEIILYQTEDGRTKIEVLLENDTVWLTQQLMAELLHTTKQNISLHIGNVFKEGELPEDSVVKECLTTAKDGKKYPTKQYNLDVIISVGYRVKSIQGTKFRIWATQRLKEYLIKGFTLDDERLKAGGYSNKYFDELLERIRDIRTSEKNFYYKVKDIYSLSADYDPNVELTQKFFATVQNKFHWAIHHHTAAELIAQRVDAAKPFMGLTAWSGSKIRKHDVTVAKNYLSLEELKQLNLLVEQFLAFAESQTQQRKVMYMKDWIKKLNDILIINEREILESPGRISKQKAEEIASAEFEKYKQIEEEAEIKQLKELEKEVKEITPPTKSRKKNK